jgi:integrase
MLDRHGKYRLRFRKAGHPTYYFKSPYPSRAFWDEYDCCVEGKAEDKPVGSDRVKPGTVHDIMNQYCAVPSRLGPSLVTQNKVRWILERDFRYFVTPSGTVVGDKLVRECTFEPLDAIIHAKAEKTPWQAKKLRRHLRGFFAFAKKVGAIDHNPVDDTELVKVRKSAGYHSWTEAEIDRYIERHPLGTKAHLALMLMLWTFQRRGDAIRMAPVHILNGRIEIVQGKTGKSLWIKVAKPLAEAIEKTPRKDGLPDTVPYLATEFGKAYSPWGFGNWFRRRCDEAGLPHCTAHGLRKAASRRAAEAGLSNQSIKSVTGHSNDSEVALYTAAANQLRMADDTIDALDNLANQPKKVDR